MAVRRSASAASSAGCGQSCESSATAWRSQSASRCARSTSARCATSALSRRRSSSHRSSIAWASRSSPPNASSNRRWVAASTRAVPLVLPMDLNQRGAEELQGLHADGLIVDEGAGAAVRELHAAQDQFILGLDVVGRRQAAHRMGARQIEGGRHLALLGPVAHQRSVAAGAERQREGVEQDGFAHVGLAGQHRKTGRDVEIEAVDQDDVADREAGQHERYQVSGIRCRETWLLIPDS